MSTRKTPEQKLAELEKKLSQTKAQIQKQKSHVKSIERRKDTRRKVIAGALALEHMAHDNQFAEQMRQLINQHVERPEDRALFDLDPKAADQETDKPEPENDDPQPRSLLKKFAGRS